LNEDLKQLRNKIDSNDSFINHGHQIKRIRTRLKDIPDWATNNAKLQTLLLTAFPKLETDPKQRQGAARWARVIHLYYRFGMPHNHVVAETGISHGTLTSLLRTIRRAANGRRGNNNQPRGARPNGRPKKETSAIS
jgi:hypothetical protein